MSAWRRFWRRLFSAFDGIAQDSADSATAVVDEDSAADPESDPDTAPVEAEPCWWIPAAGAVPAATPLASPTNAALVSQLEQAIELSLADPQFELPKLSHVIDRALTMLRRDNADYAALARLIGEDPALAAQILRVANSAYFAANAKILALQPAFARLGIRTIRGIILSASLKNFSIRIDGGNRSLGEDLWRRSLAGGVIMSAAAKHCGLDPEDAFLAGLLHNIGDFVVMMIVHQETRGLPVKATRDTIESLATAWHEQAGVRLAEIWQLPSPLPELIADHHRLPAPGDPHEKLRLLILFADVVRSLLGIIPYHPYDFFATPCVQRLGFKDTPEVRGFLRTLPTQIDQRIEGL